MLKHVKISMMKPFRLHHVLKILEGYSMQALPIDLFLRNYLKKTTSIGSKDRSEICEVIYNLIRWRGLVDFNCSKPITWGKRVHALQSLNYKPSSECPNHIKVSFTKFLFDKLVSFLGIEDAMEFCKNSNTQAPLTIRVNPTKISRKNLYTILSKNFKVKLCQFSKLGITFEERINFSSLQEFKNGLFEVQDEGSQLIAASLDIKPGEHVLDMCAGAGGKSLAFAYKTQQKGQIYLHDVRPIALLQARKRFKKAGIQNYQTLDPKKLNTKRFKNRMDWILIDVPCSGSGTLRRNPDLKWKINQKMIEELVAKQEQILASSLNFIAPRGKIVYATCSVLPEENIQQVERFGRKFGFKLLKDPYQSFPTCGQMDGFFFAVMAKK